jgi:hypothetical protein
MPSSPTRDENPRGRHAGATESECRPIVPDWTDQQRQIPQIDTTHLESSKFWKIIGKPSLARRGDRANCAGGGARVARWRSLQRHIFACDTAIMRDVFSRWDGRPLGTDAFVRAMEGRTMIRTLAAATLLALAAVAPVQPAAAQDAPVPAGPPPNPGAPVGGAIVGGALGGIIGGALGRGPGAVAGAIIGGTTGAVVASEAQARPNGYYWWRGGCYYRYPNGAWSPPMSPYYCGY